MPRMPSTLGASEKAFDMKQPLCRLCENKNSSRLWGYTTHSKTNFLIKHKHIKSFHFLDIERLETISAKNEYCTLCTLHDLMHLHTESAQSSMNPFNSWKEPVCISVHMFPTVLLRGYQHTMSFFSCRRSAKSNKASGVKPGRARVLLVILIVLPHLFNIITNYCLCHSRDPTMTMTKSHYGASQDAPDE